MYEKLVAFKEWCENTDPLILGIGFIVAALLVLSLQAVLPYEKITAFFEPAPMAETDLSFDDVPPDHWAYDEIRLIHTYGITVGCSYDPPLYCPDRPATRAELAVMLSRILEIIELGGE